MGRLEVSPFSFELMIVKALDLCENLVCGFYNYDPLKDGVENIVVTPFGDFTVNPKTICRNSGIKDKNGHYVHEYDLLKITHGIKPFFYGFIVWDEFYKSWKIRRRTDRTSYCNVDDWTIEVVGNVVLNDEDAEIIYNQEKEEDEKEAFIDNSYCPSKFRR